MSASHSAPKVEEAELYHQLVETVRDYAIFMLDPVGRIATWNSGAQLIKGYTAEEAVGSHFSMFYTAEDIAAGRPQFLLDTAAAIGRVEDEGWRVRKDGSRFWAEVLITSRHGDDGELLGFAKVTRDLTVRRIAMEQLRRSEERARLVIEGVTDYAIFMLDPAGLITTWNAGAERIKGYQADEIIGQSFSRFYLEEDLRAGKPAMELEVAARDGRFEDEGWRVRKDGSKFWANVVLTALHDAGGTLMGYANVTRDLTERVLLEEERLRSARAEEAVRLRDEFLATVAHELRTPLTAMQLGLHGVHERLVQEQHALTDRLARALRGGNRLTALIERLLDVSRISSGVLDLTPERVDLAELVAHVVDVLRPLAERSNCELRLHASADTSGCWDPLRLGQAVSNLLENAIKFGAEQPIDLGVTGDADAVELQVSDRGLGVADADAERIFERFERATSIRQHPGLGVGLYVVRRVVEAHRGTVAVHSRDGGGSTFVVRLPRAVEAS